MHTQGSLGRDDDCMRLKNIHFTIYVDLSLKMKFISKLLAEFNLICRQCIHDLLYEVDMIN